MALTIILDPDKAIMLRLNTKYEWHVGEVCPIDGFKQTLAVTMIQADGHELDHIKMMFHDGSFPHVWRKQVQRFYGDFAKQIVGNL